MHELGIARDLLALALTRAQNARATVIEQITIDNGVMSGVEEHALRFAFGALAKGTAAEKAILTIRTMPLRCQCAKCRTTFECKMLSYSCPDCGTVSHDVRSGKELMMISLEVN